MQSSTQSLSQYEAAAFHMDWFILGSLPGISTHERFKSVWLFAHPCAFQPILHLVSSPNGKNKDVLC